MKLALVGTGRMGAAVRETALQRGHEITAAFDEDQLLTPSADLAAAEVIVDFSTAAAVPSILRTAAARGVPVVEGTTGWYQQLADLKALPGLTMVYSPNFSPGVYHFTRLVELAGKLLGSVGGYDLYVHEWHHAGKIDSPSGTAGRLAEVLLREVPSKASVLSQSCHGRIDPRQLHVTSTRVGRIPGTHEVGFDSACDSVTLRHQAWGREGFALGAVLAAEWVRGRQGVFTMDDFMAGLAGERSEP